MKRERISIRTAAAAGSCKLARKLLRIFGKGGTTVPGRIAMAIDPGILERVSRGMHVVLVTGTNGKTTTCRMIWNAVTHSGEECLLNRSGANLLPGITAEFVCNTDRGGDPRFAYAVIECDEGALKQVTQRIRPEVIVVTNLFRDQLDRYGEVMHTREEILKGILGAPGSTVVLNADCPLTASLKEEIPGAVLFFGSDVPAGAQEERELSDSKYCIHCGAELSYEYYTYSHLGNWKCPVCGRRRPEADTAAVRIEKKDENEYDLRMRIRGRELSVKTSLPAVYNIYNALAAACAANALGLPRESIEQAIEGTKAPFGRMESFVLGDCPGRMILVKNPAGCSQAVEYVMNTGEEYGIVFCLNDKTADGHDISWIWDADLEKIIEDPKRKDIWVSGTRAEDMQLRLKYAGADENSITLEKDYTRLLESVERKGRRVFVLPNYTSMLGFRDALMHKTGGDAFWKG